MSEDEDAGSIFLESGFAPVRTRLALLLQESNGSVLFSKGGSATLMCGITIERFGGMTGVHDAPTAAADPSPFFCCS